MIFSVRVAAPLQRLAARMRAAAASSAGRRSEAGSALRVALPATSALRDPAEIAAMFRFEEAPAEAT